MNEKPISTPIQGMATRLTSPVAHDEPIKRLWENIREYDLAENVAELDTFGLTIVPPEKSIQTSTFRRYFMDAAHRIFESAVPDPARFTYKAVDREFTAWGYGFVVERPNAEFLNISNASLDGRDLTLGGTGKVTVTTPAVFQPNGSFKVVRTPAGGLGTAETVAADGLGRIAVAVDLGPGRLVDERRAPFEAALFQIPQTRIQIFDE